MDEQMTVTTLKISRSDQQRLRAIAAAHGLTIGRGRLSDVGSIKQLVEAVASGRLIIVQAPGYNGSGN